MAAQEAKRVIYKEALYCVSNALQVLFSCNEPCYENDASNAAVYTYQLRTYQRESRVARMVTAPRDECRASLRDDDRHTLWLGDAAVYGGCKSARHDRIGSDEPFPGAERRNGRRAGSSACCCLHVPHMVRWVCGGANQFQTTCVVTEHRMCLRVNTVCAGER